MRNGHSRAEASSAANATRQVSIEGILAILPDAPVASTRGRGWGGVTLDRHGYRADYALATPGHDHHLVCYCPSGSARLIQARDGAVHSSMISAGMSLLLPSAQVARWDGDAPASARLRVPTALVAAAAEQIGRQATTRFEIRTMFEMRDGLIERIALALMAEFDRAPHPAQALIAETLSCALAAHMLRSYNAFDPPAEARGLALGARDLARLTDHIEAHIDRPIGLAELAALVNVSRFHFTRLFKAGTGMTAIRYVETCRIRRAQALITGGDLPLAEIALMCGFSDQSHFTRRFHRQVGRTPAAFARENGRRRTPRRGS